jgi:transcriptional regulator with XRE-family HTH domain
MRRIGRRDDRSIDDVWRRVDYLRGHRHGPSWRYAVAMQDLAFGVLLRDWRQRRRLSQLALAGDADISTRHLSFLESGRATPSRDMVVRLAEQLDVPLRERNRWLLAAGFAPLYPERALEDAALQSALLAVDRVLQAHGPFPGLAVDRHWTMVRANRVVAPLLGGAAPSLLTPPINVIRLTLHPQGLWPLIVNRDEWRAHILARLGRQVRDTGDQVLAALFEEM